MARGETVSSGPFARGQVALVSRAIASVRTIRKFHQDTPQQIRFVLNQQPSESFMGFIRFRTTSPLLNQRIGHHVPDFGLGTNTTSRSSRSLNCSIHLPDPSCVGEVQRSQLVAKASHCGCIDRGAEATDRAAGIKPSVPPHSVCFSTRLAMALRNALDDHKRISIGGCGLREAHAQTSFLRLFLSQ